LERPALLRAHKTKSMTYFVAYDDRFGKFGLMSAGAVVYLVWIWLAVRTTNVLRVLTGHTIPFSKRAIWITKIVALIVGGGGLFTLLDDLKLRWYLAAIFPGIVVFFALREKIEAIVSPVPPQTVFAYRSSWEEYRHLSRNVRRWWVALGIAILGMVVVGAVSRVSGQSLQIVFSIGAICFIACWAGISFTQFKLMRWRCPRCGNSFRGFWGRPFMPRKCCYCGLPRWHDNPSVQT
jgi:hypothetical protein